MSLKYFVELPCDNVEIISAEIYKFLETNTDLINSDKFGWNFVDCKRLLNNAPTLLEFFKTYKLIPRHAAITIVLDNTHLPKHIDELPVVAKINFPVINAQGWANRWYENDRLVAELLDMKLPIVFNSQVVHSVEKTTATISRSTLAPCGFTTNP